VVNGWWSENGWEGYTDGWMDERMEKRNSIQRSSQIPRQKRHDVVVDGWWSENGWEGCMDGWMDGCMVAWMDERMKEWINATRFKGRIKFHVTYYSAYRYCLGGGLIHRASRDCRRLQPRLSPRCTVWEKFVPPSFDSTLPNPRDFVLRSPSNPSIALSLSFHSSSLPLRHFFRWNKAGRMWSNSPSSGRESDS